MNLQSSRVGLMGGNKDLIPLFITGGKADCSRAATAQGCGSYHGETMQRLAVQTLLRNRRESVWRWERLFSG